MTVLLTDFEGTGEPTIHTMQPLTADAARKLALQIGRLFPAALLAAVRELNLLPTAEPVYRAGCRTCFEGSPVPDGAVTVTCGECAPSLHDHDCQCCDGAMEVTDGE